MAEEKQKNVKWGKPWIVPGFQNDTGSLGNTSAMKIIDPEFTSDYRRGFHDLVLLPHFVTLPLWRMAWWQWNLITGSEVACLSQTLVCVSPLADLHSQSITHLVSQSHCWMQKKDACGVFCQHCWTWLINSSRSKIKKKPECVFQCGAQSSQAPAVDH